MNYIFLSLELSFKKNYYFYRRIINGIRCTLNVRFFSLLLNIKFLYFYYFLDQVSLPLFIVIDCTYSRYKWRGWTRNTLHKRILIQIETKIVWAGLTISGTRQDFREELRIVLYDLNINKY